jgi:hypothetical protein
MNDTRDLTCRLADLLRRERAALAEFLLTLADFDRERRWLELGHASLFYFLHRELGLSKGAAFYRKTAAELVQRYPEVVEPLRDGRLCLTSVVELAKVLTPENRHDVLPRFFHASKGEAKAISAELRPADAAPHRDAVTAVRAAPAPPARAPAPAATPAIPATGLALASAVRPDEPLGDVEPSAPSPAPAPRPIARPSEIEPLTAELSRLHVTVSKEFLAKLAKARDALSHSHPRATTETVLGAALDLLLAAHDKRKGLVKKPRAAPPRPSNNPRHIPADVKRAVWRRDEGRCQWPLASGGVCGSKTRLQLDHVVPLARGGVSTVSNIRVLCAFHNGLAARQVFGAAWMDRFRVKVEPEGAPQMDSPGRTLGLFTES